MKWILLILLALGIFIGVFFFVTDDSTQGLDYTQNEILEEKAPVIVTPETKNTTETQVGTFPVAKLIPNLSWVAQTFNNCSSVALMIALSHWGIKDTQEAIAEGTRPWNNLKGNNDDKSVTLHELAAYANAKYGLVTYVRPNGDIELLKKFIANDIPVLTRTLMYPKDDIVHYRVVRGYNEAKKIVIQSDGVEGKEEEYSYEDWLYMWKDFNYSYLIIVPEEKRKLAESLLGEQLDEQVAWERAKTRALSEISKNPSNLVFKYNYITALYYLGDYEGTIREFEKIETSLSRRKLWYQMEPIEAYFKLAKYDRVIELTDYMANDNNKSISELYVLKGKILESRGKIAEARAEYEKAIYYNKNLQSAKDALIALK